MKRIIHFITLIIFGFTCNAQPGTVDMSFNPGDIGNDNGDGIDGYSGSEVNATKIQNDGKIVIGGYDYYFYNGTAVKTITRLNADGKLDTSFVPSFLTSGYIMTIFIQSDGKIIIGGRFRINNETTFKYLARLNNDGSLDTSFNLTHQANNDIYSIAIQNDGRIIVVGRFTSYNGFVTNRIARLNSDGTLDNTFNIGSGANNEIRTLTIQADGKIIIGGYFTAYNGININRIARLNSDGTLDNTFNIGSGPNGIISTLDIQVDGKIVIGGNFTAYNGININRIARLNSDGTLDNTFNIGSGPNGIISTLDIQDDGKIVIGGNFSTFNGTTIYRIARLNIDGALDNTFINNRLFDGSPINVVKSIAIQADGKIIVGGTRSLIDDGRKNILRLDNNSALDTTFNIGTGASSFVSTSFIQNNGKILIGGSFESYNNTACNGIVRVNNDGSIDNTFNNQDIFSKTYCIATQIDDKIILGGGLGYFNQSVFKEGLARLNFDGSLDTSFNISGLGLKNSYSQVLVYNIAIQNDGKIIVVGQFTSYNGVPCNNIVRLNSDGTFDNTFIVDSIIISDTAILSLAIQNDGRIIIGGLFTSYNGISCNNIARLNNDGSFDYNFNSGLGATGGIKNIEFQIDGKIIVGGLSSYNGISCKGIARLNSDGTIDSSFNSNLNTTFGNYNVELRDLAIQNNGKIIIVGNFYNTINFINNYNIARLNSDGTIDSTFNSGIGCNSYIVSASIQNDGKIIIGGGFRTCNGTGRNRIARINGDNALETFNIEKNSIVIYPNPVTNLLQIQTSNNTSITSSKILDLSGKVIIEQKENCNKLNTETLSKGFYILEVFSDRDKFTSKFIKE
jgi:uncharacterized delta-60 repeat protein